jgi:hypothetical protein
VGIPHLRSTVGRTHPTANLVSHRNQKTPMAKPHRVLKKPNHGSRPANSKARRLKRKQIKT